MKAIRLAMLGVVALLAVACNNQNKPQNILKDGAMLYVNVKNEAAMKAVEGEVTPVEGDEFQRLTPKELVEKAGMFYFVAPDGGKALAIADEQKDVENARIKMWGQMIIKSDGSLDPYFVELRDVRIGIPVVEGNIGGYIPNAVMEKAEREIKRAYAEGRLEDVYRLFHEAYTAIPCTEKEWLALKEQGKQ